MRCRIAILVFSAVILGSLVSTPASAGEGGYYRERGWGRGTLPRHVWHHRSCRCGLGRVNLYYTPAQDYAAFYYNSRGGVGRGYSTTAYSTNGYPHHYRR